MLELFVTGVGLHLGVSASDFGAYMRSNELNGLSAHAANWLPDRELSFCTVLT